jgi:hypothetical protein
VVRIPYAERAGGPACAGSLRGDGAEENASARGSARPRWRPNHSGVEPAADGVERVIVGPAGGPSVDGFNLAVGVEIDPDHRPVRHSRPPVGVRLKAEKGTLGRGSFLGRPCRQAANRMRGIQLTYAMRSTLRN